MRLLREPTQKVISISKTELRINVCYLKTCTLHHFNINRKISHSFCFNGSCESFTFSEEPAGQFTFSKMNQQAANFVKQSCLIVTWGEFDYNSQATTILSQPRATGFSGHWSLGMAFWKAATACLTCPLAQYTYPGHSNSKPENASLMLLYLKKSICVYGT